MHFVYGFVNGNSLVAQGKEDEEATNCLTLMYDSEQ